MNKVMEAVRKTIFLKEKFLFIFDKLQCPRNTSNCNKKFDSLSERKKNIMSIAIRSTLHLNNLYLERLAITNYYKNLYEPYAILSYHCYLSRMYIMVTKHSNTFAKSINNFYVQKNFHSLDCHIRRHIAPTSRRVVEC